MPMFGGDPINGADPTGLCRIDVGFRRVLGSPWFHGFVLTTDPSGLQMALSGRPERFIPGFWGRIVTEGAPYPESAEYPGPEQRYFSNALDDDCSCEPFNSELQETVDLIEATGTKYRLRGLNSNTVATLLLISVGLSAPPLPPGVSAPGYVPGP